MRTSVLQPQLFLRRNKNMKNTYSIERALVATTPRHLVTHAGLPITSFRVAHSFTKPSHDGGMEQSHTNWFTITSFGELATEMAEKVSKGNRIDLTGLMFVRDWDNGERAGTSVEIEVTEYAIRYPEPPATRTHDCNCVDCVK
jgi:single-stranded DNA-binding protein